ncbi:hypothetical protein A9R05_05605 [Burkholderia sp. KK1]|nr:hypothetical protein A9R05_05605 [Burkholderia sp. KK1]
MTDKISKAYKRFAGLIAILLIGVSVFFAGMATMYWINRGERMQLLGRFPAARATAAASATEAADARYAVEIGSLKAQNESLKQSQEIIARSVADTNAIAAYTLRFLGDRARINDARQATLMKQAKEATAAASAAAQKTEAVEQKVAVAATKADEAANTAKAVDKKLETATHPALPAQPWAGSRR